MGQLQGECVQEGAGFGELGVLRIGMLVQEIGQHEQGGDAQRQESDSPGATGWQEKADGEERQPNQAVAFEEGHGEEEQGEQDNRGGCIPLPIHCAALHRHDDGAGGEDECRERGVHVAVG